MKVLRVHAPGTPARLAADVGRAVVAFNRGLDIRLRFLSIGIEESVLEVTEAAGAAEAVAAAIASAPPDVVLVCGDGPAALAAAACTVRERALLARVGAGRRSGGEADAARAVDRLAAIHLVHGAADAASLDAEGATAPRIDVGSEDDPGTGERIVAALSRARRSAQGRTTGGI